MKLIFVLIAAFAAAAAAPSQQVHHLEKELTKMFVDDLIPDIRIFTEHRKDSTSKSLIEKLPRALGTALEHLAKLIRPMTRKKNNQNVKAFEIPSNEVLVGCLGCRTFFNLIKTYIQQGHSQAEATELIVSVCEDLNMEQAAVCEGVVSYYVDEFYYILSNVDVPSATICSVWLQSFGCWVDDYADKSVNWSIPLDDNKPTHVTPDISNYNDATPLKVLHLSDIHFDANYTVGAATNCDNPICCRSDSGVATSDEDAAGQWGMLADCDVPFSTVVEAIYSIQSQHPDLDYIILTGDLPSHNVWETSRGESTTALYDVAGLLQSAFPDIPVYPVLGNHEPHPFNNFPSTSIDDPEFNSEWLYDAAAEDWSQWLNESALETVRKAGYYSQLHSTGLRIIGLNSNLPYIMNTWLLYDTDDPEGMLAWLANELAEAESNGEKVHILGHVPPGNQDCWSVWSREFSRIINRYEDTVAAQFYGHTHNEDFRILYESSSDASSRATSVLYVGGSITTYSRLNPGYRVYYIDGDRDDSTRTVLDFETWVYDINAANSVGTPSWYKLYSARQDYDMQNLLPESWDDLVNRLATNQTLFDMYYTYYVKDSSVEVGGCSGGCRESRLCQTVTVDNSNDAHCNAIIASIQ